MDFYFFTLAGLEQIAAGEVREKLKGARCTKSGGGIGHFQYRGDGRQLLGLQTTEDVFAKVAQFNLQPGKKGLESVSRQIDRSPLLEPALAQWRQTRGRRGANTYRVVAQRQSSPTAYLRKELQHRVARGFAARFPRWRLVDDQAHLEIWLREERRQVLCGLRLSDRTMRHRQYKRSNIAASLRPVLAHAMVRLSHPEPGDTFLDPMCGAGTLLIERAEAGRYAQLLGGDIDPAALTAARDNIGKRYQPLRLESWDATRLPLAKSSVDRLVCNLPFGKKIASPAALPGLYRAFAGQAARVLAPGGRLVLLTSAHQLLLQAAQAAGLSLKKAATVEVLGQGASIYTGGHRR